MINRKQDLKKIRELIREFSATAILGARQIGKTTIARQIKADYYFDLENPRDIIKFENPQLTLEKLSGLIVIDEVQRKPELFALLRFLIDQNPKRKFLILGSASRDLLRQSSETLAGRIAYYHLGGLRIADTGKAGIEKMWLCGQFPKAYTARSPQSAFRWLNNYISSFLERDIPQLGINIPAMTLRKFWSMLAHYHGQVMNYSELAVSFGLSEYTVKKYVDILCGTFMVRMLQPWFVNIGKRLVKKPKIYIRDSGIFHTLLSIDSRNSLLSHNKLGASWEGFALEVIAQVLDKQDSELFFWRTHAGNEIDLFWQQHGKNWGIEFKYSDAPRLTPARRAAVDELELEHLWIVYPGTDEYKIDKNITVLPLANVENEWNYTFAR
jgi:predicted AAA+ superfamily ATPase